MGLSPCLVYLSGRLGEMRAKNGVIQEVQQGHKDLLWKPSFSSQYASCNTANELMIKSKDENFISISNELFSFIYIYEPKIKKKNARQDKATNHRMKSSYKKNLE